MTNNVEVNASDSGIAISSTGSAVVHVNTGFAVSLEYFEKYAREHNIIQSAVDEFLRTVVSNKVPAKELDFTLTQIARRYVRLGDELLRYEPAGNLATLWEKALEAHSDGQVDKLGKIMSELRSKERENVRALLNEATERSMSLAKKSAWIAETQLIQLDFYSASLSLREAISDLPNEHPKALEYLCRLSSVEYLRGELKDSLTEANRAIEFSNTTKSRQSYWLCEAYRRKGAALRDLGEYSDAEQSLQHSLEFALDADQRLEIDIELAGLLIDQSHFEAASPLLHGIEDRLRSSTSEEKRADTLYLLGKLHGERKDWVAAERTLSDAAKCWSEASQKFNLQRLRTLRSLAFTLRHLRSFDKAANYLAEVEFAINKVYGRNHPEYVTLLDEIAGLAFERGDLITSEQQYYEAIKLGETVLSRNHPDVAQAWNNLGLVLQRLGKKEATTAFRRAAEGFETVLGGKHPDTATAWHNLANNLLNLGEYAEATSLVHRSKAVRVASLGDNHQSVLDTLVLESMLLECQGDLLDAIDIQTEVVGRRAKISAGDISKRVIDRVRLASLLRQGCETKKALSMSKKALFEAKRMSPRDHFSLGLTLNNLGEISFSMARHCRAYVFLSHAVRVYEYCYPNGSQDLATSLINKAAAAYEVGSTNECEKIYERAIGMFDLLLPGGSQLGAIARYNFAKHLLRLGDPIRSDEMHKAAISIIGDVLNSEHPIFKKISMPL